MIPQITNVETKIWRKKNPCTLLVGRSNYCGKQYGGSSATKLGAFLVVQWLGTACKAGHMGLIPGWGTMIPHAMKSRSPRAATREPAGSEASAPQPESTQHGESLHWHGENAPRRNQDPHGQISRQGVKKTITTIWSSNSTPWAHNQRKWKR